MRSKLVLVGSIVLLLLLLGSYLNSPVNNSPSQDMLQIDYTHDRAVIAHTPHAPIIIISDADFETQSWPGNGTLDDPYIISGLEINSTEICIDIQNTRAYFKVMNCIISSPSASSNEGIHFENVTNGVVRDCVVDSHIEGFYLREITTCNFINNSALINGQIGFLVYFGDHCRFINNTAIDGTETGFMLGESGNCTLTNNTATGFRRGFHIDITKNCSLTDNTAKDNVQWGFLIDTHSHNTTVTDNIAINNTNGVALDNSDNCTLSNNVAEDNSWAGFILSFSHNNTFFDNFAEGSSYGFKLHVSHNVKIYGNTMISNTANAEDEGGIDSLWDDGVSIGNIWDDYLGGGVYTIQGSAGSVDRYPRLYDLVLPIIDSPVDVSYSEGTTGNTISWTPVDANPYNYTVYRNGIELVSGTWDGSQILVDVDGLSVGTYNYTLEVIDLGHNTATDSVVVTVTEEVLTSTTSTGSPTTHPEGLTMMTLMIGAGAIVAIIVIIILALKKKGG